MERRVNVSIDMFCIPIFRRFKNLLADSGGIAAAEFALLLPMLMAMFLGTFEVSRYILINQKVEKTAHTVADIVAQATTISTAELDDILSATGNLMSPYSFATIGRVIVTSVSQDDPNPPRVQWQYSGGGTLIENSRIGATGQDATLPEGFIMNDRDNIIIAEVFYDFSPLVPQEFLTINRIYKTAIFKPRLGALDTLN